jgi:inner membrane protein
MDNLSHSLAGLAVGELLHRTLTPEADAARQSVRRRVLLVTAWAASNLPDLDLFLTPLLPTPLGYLLHHRGHTHTLLYAIPQALAVLAAIWLLWPTARALLRASSQARRGIVAASGLGLLLHMAMDYLNVYGVHLLYPFDPRWQYGDMVFIIEPAFWVIFGAPLAAMVRTAWLRVILFGLLAAIPVLATLAGFLQWGSTAGLAVIAFVLIGWQRRAGGRAALGAAFAMALGVVTVQGLAGRVALDAVMAQLPATGGPVRVLDVPLSAYPANPVCWNFATVESDETAGSYRLRRGVVSIAPWLTAAAACPAPLRGAAALSATPTLAWLWDQPGSLATLRALQRDNCHFDAWLRFARVPWVGAAAATDARYGAPNETNFSTMRFAELALKPCSRHVPGWGRPREDLLHSPAQRQERH